jgi:hypothetical protein
MEDIKRTRIFIFMVVVFLFVGVFTAQTIYWFKVGKSGLAWTEHEGYKNALYCETKIISISKSSILCGSRRGTTNGSCCGSKSK